MLVWKYRYENCISLTYNFKLVSNIINGGFNDGTVIILWIALKPIMLIIILK